MVVQVYISGVSGNTEVKSRQQRVLSILDAKSIEYEIVDITGEDSESHKIFMRSNATSLGGTMNDPNPKYPLPPQFFNNDVYCGDYNLFDTANELGELDVFLKLVDGVSSNDQKISTAEIVLK
ncbi:SH3 domain-binding glutamic acid-rich protein homolog [Diorhabda sublineata]|uniref:SH3 domain-binding glutamic acid-rich protein homolog n=1 Tax=Diorhabda sublineata TaxID=1163346 RepID=UPI0024E100A6|nr:SH3 domain-binding glutamic acid-rich protein homolog [Diorhabda sublineata]